MFGATDLLANETANLPRHVPIVVQRLRHMTAIDANGLDALARAREIYENLSGVGEEFARDLSRTRL